MPLSKLQFRPGINKESTTYANEGGFYACDKIRFRSGYPEKLGGWANQSLNYTFNGVPRALWNWASFSGENLLGVGTNQKYLIEYGSKYFDITPLRTTETLGSNPFAVTSGSKVIVVTDVAHGATVNSFVTFSGATAVGGLTLNGEFEIVSTIDADSYRIVSPTAASSPGSGGGSSVVAAYQINAGNAVYTTGSGWGVPPWGAGGWGSATAVGIPLTLWSQDNFEQNLILVTRNGLPYYWPKDTVTFNRAVPLSTSANALTKVTTVTTASAIAGATSIVVDDATGINTGSVVTGTNIPAGTYVTTSYNGSLTIPLSAAIAVGGVASGATITFSYAGRHVPSNINFVLASDTSHFTIALGSTPYNPTNFTGTFDPMLVRWSEQDNPFEWVPEVTNQSGEQHLSNGSFLVCAKNTRQETLIWSNTALYSMQYLGPPYVWGFNPVADNISIASPGAAVTANNVTYWMGEDKFYQYSGRVETLPCSLRQFIFSNINKNQMFQIISGTNEGFNEVWWFYPSAGSNVNDTYIIYNHLERIWYYGSLTRTAWLDSPLRQFPLAAFGIQNSYLDSAMDSTQNTVTLINASSYPTYGTVTIDSEQISYTGIGGNVLTGCTRGVNATTAASHALYAPVSYTIPNQVVNHEYGNDDLMTSTPQAITSFIESSDFDIGDGHNFGYVWRMLPDLTFVGSDSTVIPKVTLNVRPRQDSGANYSASQSPEVTWAAYYPIEQYTGEVFTRIRGRQMAFRIESDDRGVAWQLGTVRIDIRADGRR
jgi:hypothetical protein